MEALRLSATQTIQDPKCREWEILIDELKKNVMLGLLDGLVRKSKVAGVKIDFYKKNVNYMIFILRLAFFAAIITPQCQK